ncbi:MAG: hypothetical protein ACFE9S_19150, partial [Candidatus Hermodarchaeota archaeon]
GARAPVRPTSPRSVISSTCLGNISEPGTPSTIAHWVSSCCTHDAMAGVLKNMNTTKNENKILWNLYSSQLNKNRTEISNSTGIALKNIGRYISSLESKGLIITHTIQEGKKRYEMATISLEGNQYIDDNINKFLNFKPVNDIESEETIKEIAEHIEKEINDDTFKAELITIINRLVIRECDAKKLGYKSAIDLRQDINERILML